MMKVVIIKMIILMFMMIMIIDTISKNLVCADVLSFKIKCFHNSFSSLTILAMCNMKYSEMTYGQPLTYLVTRNPARLTQAFASR